jgi:hypothetical protein
MPVGETPKAPKSDNSKKGVPGIICKSCEAPIELLKSLAELGDPFDSSCQSCGDISTYHQDDIVVLQPTVILDPIAK